MAVYVPALTARSNVLWLGAAFGIYGYNDALCAVALRGFADDVGVGYGCRVKAGFVCACVEQAAHVLHGAHAAAYGKRDEDLRGYCFDDGQYQVALITGGGDVEKGELISALLVVAGGNFDRVARVTQFNKIDAFDHAATSYVKTGNDSFS